MKSILFIFGHLKFGNNLNHKLLVLLVNGALAGLMASCSNQDSTNKFTLSSFSDCSSVTNTSSDKLQSPCLTDNLGQSITIDETSSATTRIPAGYYDGSQTINLNFPSLNPENIKAGISLFGTIGTLDGKYSACTDNVLNSAACSASSNRYVTATLGGNLNGPDGSVSITTPRGFYPGTTTVTMADSDLVASNIKSGVTIFGVTGSAAMAYNACVDNSLNANQCTQSANKYSYTSAYGGRGNTCSLGLNSSACWTSSTSQYVTGTLGANLSAANGQLSTTIPSGYYNGSTTVTMNDSNLSSGNIKSGVSIFGVTGSWAGDFRLTMGSTAHREPASTQITLYQETEGNKSSAYTNSFSGYRAVPVISKDDDGYNTISSYMVNRSSWSATTCGTSATTIAGRIADCASVFGAEATWDGGVKGNAGQGVWKLVTRTGSISSTSTVTMGKEVWQDQRTKLLWSSRVAANINWCKASGVNNISGNPTAQTDSICGNSSYQNTSGKAISACFEDGENYFTQTPSEIVSAGKSGLGLSSSPVVAWRLPTRYDYMQAEINGIRYVMPDMFTVDYTVEWTASVISNLSTAAWYYGPQMGGIYKDDTSYSSIRYNGFAVRCVGR